MTFLFQEDLVQKERKPKKPKTKIAAAKKILNKNVKINTKIVFDDEGEVRYKLFNILCTLRFLLRDVFVVAARLRECYHRTSLWFGF